MINPGSTLIIGLEGESLTPEEKKLIPQVGGVILFQKNCQSHKSLKNLCSEIKSIKTPTPLIISVDREGGTVDRLRKIDSVAQWPSFSSLEPCLSLKEIEKTSFLLHQELKYFGINMNFSPCVDISNPKSDVLKNRTFSSNPLRVMEVGEAIIRGAQRAQVLSCMKHFPGHGGVNEDTHFVSAVDKRPLGQIRESLLPFRGAIASKVEAAMIAHVEYSSLDEGVLAPFSKKILQKLLQEELGFNGFIVTDDLDMKALDGIPLEILLEKSLQAGTHMFICGQNRDKVIQALDLLKNKRNLSRIAEQQAQKLVLLKKRYQTQLTSRDKPQLNQEGLEWLKSIQAKISLKFLV